VITAENVTRLIEKMGTIADFSSLEEKEEAEEVVDPASDDFYKYVTPPNAEPGGYKKLMRMEHKKILGGVCAGIAHYFAIDALWIRLIAILLLFTETSISKFLISILLAGWTSTLDLQE